VVLPPLLYAAALEQPTGWVRADWRVLGGLAVGLVLASTFAVAAVASTVVAGLPATAALTLGAILASTDAVAVTALARRLALPRRLVTLVQAESLLNDATSLVIDRVAVGAAASGVALHLGYAGLQLVVVAAGGAAVGLARVELLLRRTLDDPLVANALSLLTPFAAYLPAEAAGVSGITAVVVCGLYLSPRTSYALSGATRLQTAAV
jgi:CPA1 family monovalent cation:H+ antiporter